MATRSRPSASGGSAASASSCPVGGVTRSATRSMSAPSTESRASLVAARTGPSLGSGDPPDVVGTGSPLTASCSSAIATSSASRAREAGSSLAGTTRMLDNRFLARDRRAS